MSVQTGKVELRELVKAHYGKALKQENRNSEGVVDVFGSSGLVGKHDQILFDYPSIIIGRKGSVGALTFAPNGGWVIDTAYYLEVIDANKVDLRYLYYALNALDLAKDTITTSIPGLNRDALLGNLISLPPLEEQKRIAAILDKADSLRRKRAQAIDLADDFLRATFLDLFGDPVTNPKGWPVSNLGQQLKFQGGFAFKSADYQKEGVRLVKISNVHYRDISWDETDFLPVNYLEKYKNVSLTAGDLLMAMTRPVIKSLKTVKLVTVRQQDLPCLLNQRVGRFTGYETTLTREFLEFFIYSDHFRTCVEQFGESALQPNVSASEIESIECYVPPFEVQSKFSLIVNKTREWQKRVEYSSDEIDCLNKSLHECLN